MHLFVDNHLLKNLAYIYWERGMEITNIRETAGESSREQRQTKKGFTREARTRLSFRQASDEPIEPRQARGWVSASLQRGQGSSDGTLVGSGWTEWAMEIPSQALTSQQSLGKVRQGLVRSDLARWSLDKV